VRTSTLWLAISSHVIDGLALAPITFVTGRAATQLQQTRQIGTPRYR
jgi:hypothetical protein